MWRLIDSGSGNAFYNMALDEAIALSIRKCHAPPTLRFYGWIKPSLSIGCFQKTNDINLGYCKENKIPIVRRPTGGRAILHHKELTYSFSARTEPPFDGSLIQCYKRISEALSMAFGRLGIRAQMESARNASYSKSPLCFQSSSYSELSLNGRKLAGSAQKRWGDCFLQQGSIPYLIDYAGLKEIFSGHETGHCPDSEAADDLSLLASDKLKEAIRTSLEEVLKAGFSLSHQMPEEEEKAQELLQAKYLQDRWNLQR